MILIITVVSGYVAFFFSSKPISLTFDSNPQKEKSNLEKLYDYVIASPDQNRGEAISKTAVLPKIASSPLDKLGAPRNDAFQIVSKLIVNDALYEVSLPENSSVYEMMKMIRSENPDFSFNGKEYSGLGFFVEEINGVRNNKDSRENYWIYYINGKKAEAGISNYIVKSGDEILWKYEEME